MKTFFDLITGYFHFYSLEFIGIGFIVGVLVAAVGVVLLAVRQAVIRAPGYPTTGVLRGVVERPDSGSQQPWRRLAFEYRTSEGETRLGLSSEYDSRWLREMHTGQTLALKVVPSTSGDDLYLVGDRDTHFLGFWLVVIGLLVALVASRSLLTLVVLPPLLALGGYGVYRLLPGLADSAGNTVRPPPDPSEIRPLEVVAMEE